MGSSLKRDPEFPLPNHLGQFLWRNPKAFLSRPKNMVPPACPMSLFGSPPRGTCLIELTSKNQKDCLGPRIGSLYFDSPDAENYSEVLLKLFASNKLFINAPLLLCMLHTICTEKQFAKTALMLLAIYLSMYLWHLNVFIFNLHC